MVYFTKDNLIINNYDNKRHDCAWPVLEGELSTNLYATLLQ